MLPADGGVSAYPAQDMAALQAAQWQSFAQATQAAPFMQMPVATFGCDGAPTFFQAPSSLDEALFMPQGCDAAGLFACAAGGCAGCDAASLYAAQYAYAQAAMNQAAFQQSQHTSSAQLAGYAVQAGAEWQGAATSSSAGLSATACGAMGELDAWSMAQAGMVGMQVMAGATMPAMMAMPAMLLSPPGKDRLLGKVVKVKNGAGIILCKEAKQRYGRDVNASEAEMQRAQAAVGKTVSFVMEFSKFEGPVAFYLQVEADDGGVAGFNHVVQKPGSQYKVRPGDWSCPKCKVWNFARNTDCRSCKTANPKARGAVNPSPANSTLASQLWERSQAAEAAGAAGAAGAVSARQRSRSR